MFRAAGIEFFDEFSRFLGHVPRDPAPFFTVYRAGWGGGVFWLPNQQKQALSPKPQDNTDSNDEVHLVVVVETVLK